MATSISIVSPASFQVFQRSANDTGDIWITGTHAQGIGVIEASWNNGPWTTIVSDPSGLTFAGVLYNQPMGQGTLKVRFSGAPGVIAERTMVGIGDIYVVAGGDNAVGWGTNPQFYTYAGLARASMYSNQGLWGDLTDSFSGGGGSWVHWLATKFLAKWPDVPIAFIPAGKTGSTIAEWQRFATNGLPNSDTPYGSMWKRIREGADGKIKGVLWFQGEADPEIDRLVYADSLSKLVDNIWLDFQVPTVVALIGPHEESDLSDPNYRLGPRMGARKVITDNPRARMGPAFFDKEYDAVVLPDGYRYTTDASLEMVGVRWWEALEQHFYGGTEGWGPKVLSASYDAKENKIYLTVDRDLGVNLTDAFSFTVLDDALTELTYAGSSTVTLRTLVISLTDIPEGPVNQITVSFGHNNRYGMDTFYGANGLPAVPEFEFYVTEGLGGTPTVEETAKHTRDSPQASIMLEARRYVRAILPPARSRRADTPEVYAAIGSNPVEYPPDTEMLQRFETITNRSVLIDPSVAGGLELEPDSNTFGGSSSWLIMVAYREGTSEQVNLKWDTATPPYYNHFETPYDLEVPHATLTTKRANMQKDEPLPYNLQQDLIGFLSGFDDFEDTSAGELAGRTPTGDPALVWSGDSGKYALDGNGAIEWLDHGHISLLSPEMEETNRRKMVARIEFDTQTPEAPGDNREFDMGLVNNDPVSQYARCFADLEMIGSTLTLFCYAIIENVFYGTAGIPVTGVPISTNAELTVELEMTNSTIIARVGDVEQVLSITDEQAEQLLDTDAIRFQSDGESLAGTRVFEVQSTNYYDPPPLLDDGLPRSASVWVRWVAPKDGETTITTSEGLAITVFKDTNTITELVKIASGVGSVTFYADVLERYRFQIVELDIPLDEATEEGFGHGPFGHTEFGHGNEEAELSLAYGLGPYGLGPYGGE